MVKNSLYCNIDIQNLTDSQLDCSNCNTCLPLSNLVYPFSRDFSTSEELVQAIIDLINKNTDYTCERSSIQKNPDIVVLSKEKQLMCRIEAKYLFGKAFMKVAEMLSDNLKPKETLVLDEPKLVSYFKCQDEDRKDGNIPIYIIWKFDRPCKDIGGITIYQNLDKLRQIYLEKGDTRKFRRKTGVGDYIDGKRFGIIDKYHFSIRECKPIELLVSEINALKK